MESPGSRLLLNEPLQRVEEPLQLTRSAVRIRHIRGVRASPGHVGLLHTQWQRA